MKTKFLTNYRLTKIIPLVLVFTFMLKIDGFLQPDNSIKTVVNPIKPAFIRIQHIAWAASYHHHRPAGDALYEYSYPFLYRLEIQEGPTKITLTNSKFVRIIAINIGDEGNASTTSNTI